MTTPSRSTTFVLLPGAGGAAWYWSLVVPLLESAGHGAIAVDLPGPDPDAGLPRYAALAAAAIDDGEREGADVVLVAQSLGGFTAAMTCAQVPVRSLILVNAMIPVPGETPGEWWGATGAVDAREEAAAAGGYGEFDLDVYFLHDVPPDVAADGEAHQRPEADAVFASACEFEGWPDIPIRVVAGADDRFFPAEFQRRVAKERLGLEPEVIPGGHLVALSQPEAVAELILRDG